MPLVAKLAISQLTGASIGNAQVAPSVLWLVAAIVLVATWFFDRRREVLLWAAFGAAGAALSVPPPRAVREPDALRAGRVRSPARATMGGWSVDVESGNATVRLAMDGPSGLSPGDVALFRASLRPPEGFANPGAEPHAMRVRREGVQAVAHATDVVRLSAARGLLPAIEGARRTVRRAIARDLGEPARSVVRALVLGETAALPGDTRQAFRATGTSHLLAVSGLHVVLFSFVAFGGLRRLALLATPLSRRTDVGRIAAAIALPTVAAYVVFAGAGASAVRAGVMAGAVLVGRAIGRPRAPVAALAVAAIAQLALEPACLFDPGWQLSYAAVVSLGTLAPAIERVMGRQPDPLEPPRTDLVARIGRWARAAVATNVATCLATAPLVAHHFGLATPASLVANLAGVPVTSALLLPGSLLYSAAVLVGARVVARALAPALTGIVAALVHGLAAIASIPGAWLEVPAPGLLAVAAMTIAILSAPVLRRPWRGLAVAAALAALAPTFAAEAAPRFRRETRVTYLDVGQGDSALVELPGGHAVLVDAGGLPGSAVDVGALEVAPYLARRGVDDLDVVILSHPHPDHFGGLPAVLGAHRARRFWDSGQGEAESLDAEHASILSAARRAGAEILLPRTLCSRPVMIAGARFETLGPCPSHDSGWGPNDNSLVVRMTFGEVRFLFPGDVESAGEAWLESRGGYSADVVKVPHHGSRTSSGPDFVAGTGAAVAVVSVGRHNRFGHPAPEVVERWRAAGTTVLRTDRDGAVVVETDGKSAWVTPTRRATGPRGAR